MAIDVIRFPASEMREELDFTASFSDSICPTGSTCLWDGTTGAGGNGESMITYSNFALKNGMLETDKGSPTRELIDTPKTKPKYDLSLRFESNMEPLKLRVRFQGKEAVLPLEWRTDATNPELQALFEVPGSTGFLEPSSGPALEASAGTPDACQRKENFGLVVAKSGSQDRDAYLCWKGADLSGAWVFGAKGSLYTGLVARAPSGDFAIAISSCSSATKSCFLAADSHLGMTSFSRPLTIRGLVLDLKWAANGDPTSLEVGFKDGTKKSIPFQTQP